jgi:hypothetical protein
LLQLQIFVPRNKYVWHTIALANYNSYLYLTNSPKNFLMPTYVIEREMAGVGNSTQDELKAISQS